VAQAHADKIDVEEGLGPEGKRAYKKVMEKGEGRGRENASFAGHFEG